MTDLATLDAWQPKYSAWRESALPLVMKGEAKSAFASYPLPTVCFRPCSSILCPLVSRCPICLQPGLRLAHQG